MKGVEHDTAFDLVNRGASRYSKKGLLCENAWCVIPTNDRNKMLKFSRGLCYRDKRCASGDRGANFSKRVCLMVCEIRYLNSSISKSDHGLCERS